MMGMQQKDMLVWGFVSALLKKKKIAEAVALG